jgi:hypothetical protein
VTSWGLSCGDPAKPGVYARVGAEDIIDWVRLQIPTAAISISPARPDPGTDVTLTATGMQPRSGTRTYRWDLDDDGNYNDASGPVATLRRIPAGSTVVRVQESYPDGDRALAREVVTTAGSPLPLPPPPPPPPPKPAPAVVASSVPPPPTAPARPSSIKLPPLARLLAGPRRIRARSLQSGRMTIGVHCSVACTLKARFTLDGRTAKRLKISKFATSTLIGTGEARLRKAGDVKLTIRLTRRAVRALRRTRSGATRVRVTARAGDRVQRLERAVTLTR